MKGAVPNVLPVVPAKMIGLGLPLKLTRYLMMGAQTDRIRSRPRPHVYLHGAPYPNDALDQDHGLLSYVLHGSSCVLLQRRGHDVTL